MASPPNLPPVINYATPVEASKVREVAMRQRAIMWCLLAYIGSVGLLMGLAISRQSPILIVLAGLCVLAALITSVVCVFRLSLSLYAQSTAIAMGCLMVVPYAGVVILLVINGTATNYLRRNGIKVGLMGANMKQIPMR